METIAYKPLNSIWLKASVTGSIWASVEIILGSFLHNLKIPLSGMFLSFISVYLLISFLQIWKENGLIWRSGLICALMKSISPSAFIVGPMIGIFTEAVLLELFIFLLGKNIIGYTIGGAFAVLSTILHKLISLLILYGFNFIKILSDLYQFAVKQIHLEKLSPEILITVIIIIYIITGITGALAGYIAELDYLKTKGLFEEKSEITLQQKNLLLSQTTKQPYSLLLLFINLFSVIAVLFLMNADFNIAATLFSILYGVFCIYKYKNSLKRLKKLSFWISFVIITFATTFLWNGFSNGVFFSIEGLMKGLKMNARALIIILGFAAISVELKNPVIKSILYHGGFANLYQSLSLAFSALPFFISTLSKRKNKRGIPINILSSLSEFFYHQNREKTMSGIERAKIIGKYKGRQLGSTETLDKFITKPKVKKVKEMLELNIGIRKISRIVECSPNFVYKVRDRLCTGRINE